MDKQVFKYSTLFACCLALVACSESTDKAASEVKKEVPKAVKVAEVEPAQDAFWEMYKPARQWAPDLLVLTLTSGEVPGLKNAEGKAGMWTAVFVSPSKNEARTFFHASKESGTTPAGISAGGAQPWAASPKSKAFQVSQFLVNSDAAYKTAYAKAEAWVKKNPDKKCTMYLASSGNYANPLWFVLWGDTKSGYLAHVDATTGALANLK